MLSSGNHAHAWIHKFDAILSKNSGIVSLVYIYIMYMINKMLLLAVHECSVTRFSKKYWPANLRYHLILSCSLLFICSWMAISFMHGLHKFYAILYWNGRSVFSAYFFIKKISSCQSQLSPHSVLLPTIHLLSNGNLAHA